MKVVVVGSGNVASIFSRIIHKAGHEIVQIVSRNIDHAILLASQYGSSSASLTDTEFAVADLYIVALTDAMLEHMEKIPALKDKQIVHTAGSVSIDVLKQITSNYGVIYPLQSLSKIIQRTDELPILVEANSKEFLHEITEFASTFSNNVVKVSEAERLHYHIAAVFAGNFTNHMYAIVENFCKKEKIDFRNLLPLIHEVNSRVNDFSPNDVQTGPAAREDIFTINKHLQALSNFPDLKYLYLKLSESILKLHEKH